MRNTHNIVINYKYSQSVLMQLIFLVKSRKISLSLFSYAKVFIMEKGKGKYEDKVLVFSSTFDRKQTILLYAFRFIFHFYFIFFSTQISRHLLPFSCSCKQASLSLLDLDIIFVRSGPSKEKFCIAKYINK